MRSRSLKFIVTIRSELVIRESDGRTLMLVATYCGTRLLGLQVVGPDDEL